MRRRDPERQRRDRRRGREDAAERPYAARCGVWGPRHFRSLGGAQGWADAQWERGHVTITDRHTGALVASRADGVWTRHDAAAAPGADPDNPPYFMRPL